MTGLFADEPHEDLLLGDLERAITDYSRSFARTQQMALGPSGVGTACERKLAMTLLESDKINDDRDEWTSSVGTAIHSWMEGALEHQNELLRQAGRPTRWLVEKTVEIRTGLKGHTDAYDLWTNTVLDHKFPGVTAIRKYRKQGNPGREYIWQAHLYGLGWARLGFPVRKVAIAMYPRSGLIRDTWLWQQPYDEAVAHEALERVDGVLGKLNAGELAAGEDGLRLVLNSMERDTTNCSWCEFWTGGPGPSSNPAKGCAGPFEDPDYQDPRHQQVQGILA